MCFTLFDNYHIINVGLGDIIEVVNHMQSRHDQYSQISYQNFLVAQNFIKKGSRNINVFIYIFTLESYHDFEVNLLVLRQ